MSKKFIVIAICLLFNTMLNAQKKALVGGTLVDGFGGKPILNSVILINGEIIEKVGRVGEVEIPKGTQIISTEGMTVMPGLWDMHVHMMINGHSDYPYWDKKYPPLFKKVIMPASAHQLLMAGVTSARDLGGPLEESLWVRDAINKGEIPGPTMYVSGPFCSTAPTPALSNSAGAFMGKRMRERKFRPLPKQVWIVSNSLIRMR